LLGVLAVGAFLGLLSGGIGPATAAQAPGTSTVPTVHITATGVDPAVVQVEPGQTVIWINDSGGKRSIVADDSSFDSGTLGQGDRFQFAFTEPGTVTYTVLSAPGVSGTVVVAAANPTAPAPVPAPAGTPPATAAPTGFAYTGAGSAFTGGAGALAVALGVALVLSARRIGLVALSGLSSFLAPDDLLPTRRHRRVRRARARRGDDR
jgi:plastocyanin